MFDWGAGNRDIIGLLPFMVQRQYFEGKGTIVIIIKEPLQTMDPKNNDLINFIKIILRLLCAIYSVKKCANLNFLSILNLRLQNELLV